MGPQQYIQNIESKGLIKGNPPYDAKLGYRLVELLRTTDFSEFDVKEGRTKTTADSIESYLNRLKSGDLRLSFSSLSGACLRYTTKDYLGGQSFGHIKGAKKIIDDAVLHKVGLNNQLPPELESLWQRLDSIENSKGVVYAIKLDDFSKVSHNLGVIYADKNIPAQNIIGKVIIPSDFDFYNLNPTLMRQKTLQKYLFSDLKKQIGD